MICIMLNLEINFIHKDEMIALELEECNEMTFVMSGRYNIGFEINKKRYFRK